MTSSMDLMPKFMILDACVLIDFVNADKFVLASITKNVGSIYVVSPVVSEVKDLENEDELTDLGVIVIEPEMEDAYIAAAEGGATSFEDKLSMLTAKRNGYVCVSNDTSLRKLCESEQVPIMWGLQLLLALHKANGIQADDAIRIANKIHETNPRHITQKIITRFSVLISNQEFDGTFE